MKKELENTNELFRKSLHIIGLNANTYSAFIIILQLQESNRP